VPFIQYEDINIRKFGLVQISKINEIISDYHRQGYDLSLRQVYYQLVSRNIIENSEKSYKNLGNLINNGRLAGLIDWDAIVDRHRVIRAYDHWEDKGDFIDAAAGSYRIDLWEDQPCYLEVWVEKDALSGIVEHAARPYDITCFTCKGYSSATAIWGAAQRFRQYSDKRCIILYLGDHDPSGIDMTRDIIDRLALFGADVEVKRIALNMEQIDQYNPPPNPAKITDTRAEGYIQKYGVNSWELDALEPSVLDALITDNIEIYLDQELFQVSVEWQESERRAIRDIGKTLHGGNQ